MSMTDVDFDYLSDLVRRRAAIVLQPGKEYLAESRLGPIARREGLPSVGDLVALVRTRRASELEAQVVDAMTTNETSFFRDSHPWNTLRDELLPRLVEARRRNTSRTLTVWCAACSSGQEPFSLAMLLREHFPDVVANWRVRIIATDYSPTMVERARTGRFSQLEVNRGLPAPLLARYFTRQGLEWQLSDEVRSLVDVRPGNLVDPAAWQILPPLDLVFLRNVLIYFDKAVKTDILGRVRTHMRNDGVLLLGSSETTVGIDHAFDRHQTGKTVYFTPG